MKITEAIELGIRKERKRILRYLKDRIDKYDDPVGERQLTIDFLMDEIGSGYHIFKLKSKIQAKRSSKRFTLFNQKMR